MLNLLVVEDNEEFLSYCVHLLRKIKNDVTLFPVASGEEALTILEQNTIDGAFLDIELPGMDGLALAKRIRDMEKYHFLPIVFVTGQDHDHPETYKQYHNIDYISKPFTENMFIERATHFLNEIKAQRKLILKKERMIILPVEGGAVSVKLSDILYAERTYSRRIKVVTRRQDYLRSHTTMEKFFAELDDEMFAYCNRSCIVNISHIEEIRSDARKRWSIIFRDAYGKTCNLSGNYYSSVKSKWQKGGR